MQLEEMKTRSFAVLPPYGTSSHSRWQGLVLGLDVSEPVSGQTFKRAPAMLTVRSLQQEASQGPSAQIQDHGLQARYGLRPMLQELSNRRCSGRQHHLQH